MGIRITLFTAGFRIFLCSILLLSCIATPAFSLEAVGTKDFFSGFKAYNNEDYKSAIEILSSIMERSSDPPLREISLYWLAQSHLKANHPQDAIRCMEQFLHEFPDSKFRKSVSADLAVLVRDQKKASQPVAAPRKPQSAEQARTEKEKPAAVTPAPPVSLADTAKKMPAEGNKAAAGTAENVEKAPPVKGQETMIPPAAPLKANPPVAAAGTVASKKGARPVKETTKKVSPRKAAPGNAMKEKAISEYKRVIDRYPGSTAAAKAAGKLKKMGIVYPALPTKESAVRNDTTKTFTLEVEKFAAASFTVTAPSKSYTAGKTFSIPFEIVNMGNGPDSFSLGSGFPPEFSIGFADRNAPGSPITTTPRLASQQKFEGIMTGVVPAGSMDAQHFAFPVKVVSQSDADVSVSREIAFRAAAPLLRALMKPDKETILPGEKVQYEIALLNLGSAPAANVALEIHYSPQFEPVDPAASGFRLEAAGNLVLDNMKIDAPESRSLSVTFRAKQDALAGQELSLRIDLFNKELASQDSFCCGTAVKVAEVRGITVKPKADRIIVIPGQTVMIPFVVTNSGNVEESILLEPVPGPGTANSIYRDLQGNGVRHPEESALTGIRPLAPREEEHLLMQVATPPQATDGSETTAELLLKTGGPSGKTARMTVHLLFARPVLDLSMAFRNAKLKPGEVSSFELSVVNKGSNLARNVELQTILPKDIDLVESDLPGRKLDSGIYRWSFPELGSGEKRNVAVTIRVKHGIAVGTSLQIRNEVSYQDQQGNRY